MITYFQNASIAKKNRSKLIGQSISIKAIIIKGIPGQYFCPCVTAAKPRLTHQAATKPITFALALFTGN
jgi:hypothetical protein